MLYLLISNQRKKNKEVNISLVSVQLQEPADTILKDGHILYLILNDFIMSSIEEENTGNINEDVSGYPNIKDKARIIYPDFDIKIGRKNKKGAQGQGMVMISTFIRKKLEDKKYYLEEYIYRHDFFDHDKLDFQEQLLLIIKDFNTQIYKIVISKNNEVLNNHILDEDQQSEQKRTSTIF
jgi:hypothetical protein